MGLPASVRRLLPGVWLLLRPKRGSRSEAFSIFLELVVSAPLSGIEGLTEPAARPGSDWPGCRSFPGTWDRGLLGSLPCPLCRCPEGRAGVRPAVGASLDGDRAPGGGGRVPYPQRGRGNKLRDNTCLASTSQHAPHFLSFPFPGRREGGQLPPPGDQRNWGMGVGWSREPRRPASQPQAQAQPLSTPARPPPQGRQATSPEEEEVGASAGVGLGSGKWVPGVPLCLDAPWHTRAHCRLGSALPSSSRLASSVERD